MATTPHVTIETIVNVVTGNHERAYLLVDDKVVRHADGRRALTDVLCFLAGYMHGETFTFDIKPATYVNHVGVVVLASSD